MAVKERQFIENIVKDSLHYLQNNKEVLKNVKASLLKHNIKSGDVMKILNDDSVLEEMDFRFLGLLIDKIYHATGDLALNPESYFSKNELIDIRNYHKEEEEKYDFPITFENAFQVSADVWYCPINVKTVAKMMKNGLLFYNPEIQRQAKKIKRKDTIIQKPTINRKSVKEIAQLLLKNELVDTTLAFNASIGSGEYGEEIMFDTRKGTVTILEGTRLDILDGFHRTLASFEALSINPDIDLNFVARISNVTDRQAQAYQAQLAKATPFHKARIKELESSRQSDFIVKQLMLNSDLKGKVSNTRKVSKSVGELVNYVTLTNAIDIVYNSKNKLESMKIAEQLTEFFDYFLATFEERLQAREEGDLIHRDMMFYAYVSFVKRFSENGIKISKIKSVIQDLDLKIDNPIWENEGIMKNGKFTSSAGKRLVKLAEDIEIK